MYWKFAFHTVEAQELILLELNTLQKIGLFTKYPRVIIEAMEINVMQQNESRHNPKQVE